MMNFYKNLGRSSKSTSNNHYDDDEFEPSQQNYHATKQICLATKKLFEDPVFSPPADSNGISWLRPGQFSLRPQFFADGVSRFDVQQGELGDCWLVAAISNLTLNRKLFDHVVPADQSFEPGAYCGLFRFKFWRFGKWVEVVVDDRLPMSQNRKEPMFVRSSDPNEFWSALLEKAYAKLYCSYEALTGGHFCEAMVDFTGGLTESYPLQQPPANLWHILKRAHERGSMLGAHLFREGPQQKAVGLLAGHQYSITAVVEVTKTNTGERVKLMRLRNPWGEREWSGAWSDRSAMWLDISQAERLKIGQTVKEDGEFWMTLEDFTKYFDGCDMCNLSPESVISDTNHRWFPKQIEGRWLFGHSTGGHKMPENAQEFAKNPQYFVKLTEPDRDDPEGNCTLVVALMQKDYRHTIGGSDPHHIGFYVFAIDQQRYSAPNHLPVEFFEKNDPLNSDPIYTVDREVTARFHLAPCTYVIVPTTYSAQEEGQFLLRIWTEHLVEFFPSNRPEPSLQPDDRRQQQAKGVASPPPDKTTTYDYVIESCSKRGDQSTVKVYKYTTRQGDRSLIEIAQASSEGRLVDFMQFNGNDLSIASAGSHDSASQPQQLYPSLSYPGQPRIVNLQRLNTSAGGQRALINIRATRVARQAASATQARFLRKIFGNLPPKLKPKPKTR